MHYDLVPNTLNNDFRDAMLDLAAEDGILLFDYMNVFCGYYYQ